MKVEGASISGNDRMVSSRISYHCLDTNARFARGLPLHSMICVHKHGEATGLWLPSPSDCKGVLRFNSQSENILLVHIIAPSVWFELHY